MHAFSTKLQLNESITMNKILILALALSCTPTVMAESINKNIDNKQRHQGGGWLRKPNIRFSNEDLHGKNRNLVIRMHVNTQGSIEKTEITKSSGISALDRKVQLALQRSKFKPYKENGIAKPFIAEQPFRFQLDEERQSEPYQPEQAQCTIEFNSDQWQAQQKNGNLAFRYITKPNLDFIPSQLMNQNRSVNVVFKLSKKNQISDLEITKSSGLTSVDAEVFRAIQSTRLDAPRKFYQFYKLTFTDRIYLNIDDCK